jgi:hypothetical protein
MRGGKLCAFAHCHNNSMREKGLGFFKLPEILLRQGEEDKNLTEERRRAWLAILDRKDLLSGSKNLKNVRICGTHFQQGV